MITDRPPKKSELVEEYRRSEALITIELPSESSVRGPVAEIEQALKSEDRRKLQKACNQLSVAVSAAFGVVAPKIQILGVRPLEESGNTIHETYGDYTFETQRIRLWMRTAVLEKPTSFGTLTSTLCHELCHHFDVVKLGLPNTYHTRGFYERAGLLYHHVRGTPVRELVWDRLSNGTYRINWTKTMKRKT